MPELQHDAEHTVYPGVDHDTLTRIDHDGGDKASASQGFRTADGIRPCRDPVKTYCSGVINSDDDAADGWFGESVAARYDAGRGVEYDEAEIERTVDVLAELAGDGAALEMAIGTGRVALPLRRVGYVSRAST